MGTKRKEAREMMEATILAKLFTDGLIKVDEEKKTVTFDCRKPVIQSKYTDEDTTYQDILSIMRRARYGMEEQGYVARLIVFDAVEAEEFNRGGNGADHLGT